MEGIGGSGSAGLQLEGMAGMPGASTQLPLLPIVSLPASAAGAYPQLPLMDLSLPASHSLPLMPGYGALGERNGCSGGVAACLPSILVTARHAMSGVGGMSDGLLCALPPSHLLAGMLGMSGLLPLPVPGLSIEQPLPSIVVGRVDSKQVGGAPTGWLGLVGLAGGGGNDG